MYRNNNIFAHGLCDKKRDQLNITFGLEEIRKCQELCQEKRMNLGINRIKGQLEILDSETFTKPVGETDTYIIVIAAYIENIRLIDNIEFRMEKV